MARLPLSLSIRVWLTRSFGQRVLKGCDTFTVPRGALAAGRIYREKTGSRLGHCQSSVAFADFRSGSFATFRPSPRDFWSSLNNRHYRWRSACLKGANFRLVHRNEELLFDHPVRLRKKHGWKIEANCVRGFQTDYQFKSARPLDRQVTRTRTPQNFID